MEGKVNIPEMVEKEHIGNLRFPNDEVLKTSDAIRLRKTNLDKALKLGNVEKGKIKIVFEDSDNIKQVETTIWGVTDQRIILKQGVVIPIHRIHEIKM
jgi:uncharacterized protein (UPF0248 family)